MILGASLLQLPAIVKAKDMGLEVVVVDMNSEAIGFKYSDYCLEISTIDIPKIVEAAKIHCIDGILTMATDMPIRSVAAVAKELHLNGVSEDTALLATDKYLMRNALHKQNVPVPEFYCVNNFRDFQYVSNSFPDSFIVKPVDSSGSRGVCKLNKSISSSDLKRAYEYCMLYSRSKKIIVEEFMYGPEVSVESIVVNGEMKVAIITDKLTSGEPFFVEMGHSQPSLLPEDVVKQVLSIAQDAIRAIALDNSPAHTEVVVTKEGPKIVEIGARLGGDNIASHLVPLSSGIDLVQCCINLALGLIPNTERLHYMASAIRYFGALQGKICEIDGVTAAEKLSGVKILCINKSIDDISKIIQNSNDRVGYVISQANDPEGAIDICEEAIKLVTIHTQPLP